MLHSRLEQTERTRNLLAFVLVGAFISMLPILVFKTIPEANEQIITYMIGQLSGMATMGLGFYFVNKVGQDALDATRADNTGKLADAMKSALDTKRDGPAGTPEDPLSVAGATTEAPPVETVDAGGAKRKAVPE